MRLWGRTVLATALVAVLPVATVWALWSLGLVTDTWISAPLAIALALTASYAAGTWWKRRPDTGDVLFSDLLLWGWLRRVRAERERADAVALLDRRGARDETEKVRLLKRLATAIDAKDPYLDGHSHRVARLSSAMAERLGVTRQEAERIRTAAAIHDVGKLHVPAELLGKPGRLTPEETGVVQRHAAEGAAMVACLGDPAISDIVRHHHERFDGDGYPTGLAGEAIPLGARIVAVADTFDAITSARPYRPARPHKVALDVLADEAGSQLDPVVVRAFVSGYSRRRGLALWTLLALPLARARRHPLPVGVVLGGIVISGVAATAVQIAGTVGSIDPQPPAQAAQLGSPPPAALRQSAPKHERARKRRPARAPTAAAAAAAATPALPRTTFASDITRSHARRPSASRRRTAAAPQHPAIHVAPPASRHVAPHPVAAPPRHRHPAPPPAVAPSPPAATTAPAAATPPPVATAPPVSTPPPVTTPASPPPSAEPQACKKGGWVDGGYRNQGQCVSGAHGH